MKITMKLWGVAISMLLPLCACHEHKHGSHDGKDTHNHTHAGHNHEGHNHSAKSNTDNAHEHSEAVDVVILAPEKAKQCGVKSIKVEELNFQKVIPATGKIEVAQNEIFTVVANVSGIIRINKSFPAGCAIAKGESIGTISAVGLQEGDPTERAKIAYETAKDEFERGKRLLEKRLITQSEFNAKKERYETAKIAYKGLAERQTAAGTSIVNLRQGYVQECLVRDGDYVTVGQTLLTMANENALFLHADVSMRYFSELENIVSANFRPSNGNSFYELTKLNGKKIAHGRIVGYNSNFIPVTFSFTSQKDLIPGSCVEVALLCAPQAKTIAIPTSSLIEEQGYYFVYLQLCAESYKKQEVKLGANNGVMVEVTEGLKAGDRVVIQGAYAIKLASASNVLPAHSHEH